ncbi:MAG: hypothetical protein M3Y58_19285 [Chloroflexota bacterium]|nr:hypothetical protein [Chloroflexota bacterium]
MTTGAGSPPEGLDRESLIGPVRRMLADAAAEILDWRHEPLGYTVRTPVSGGCTARLETLAPSNREQRFRRHYAGP